MFIFTFKHTKIRTDFIILKIPRVENTSILRSFTCCLPTYCKLSTILQTVALNTKERRLGAVGCDKNLVWGAAETIKQSHAHTQPQYYF